MNKLALRLLLFFVVFPALVAVIFLLPQYDHLALNVIIVAASALGALETARLFEKKGVRIRTSTALLLGAVLPVAAYLEIAGALPDGAVTGALILSTSALFAIPSLTVKNGEFSGILPLISALIVTLFYPGFFMTYTVRLSDLEGGSILLSTFVVAVYLNDALAFAAGNLFGKGNRNIVAVSPNKSLIGFIVGFLTSPAVFMVSRAAFPSLFPGPLWKVLIPGFVVGLTTILGDLLESAMKRSSQVKDSGTIIPGRGGLLDSVDSIIYSAPFFYYLYILIYGSAAG